MDDNQTPVTASTTSSLGFKGNLGIPIAIIIAAILVAGAILYSGSLKSTTMPVATTTTSTDQATPEMKVEPVTEKDHIRGNPNAPIMIVEYSDYDCPFCKNFHTTMNQVMADYGADGKVAWVYRQFPLQQLHPNAPKLAAASECVAELGGNDAFWKFTDLVFDGRDVNESTDLTKLPSFAQTSGVDKDKFELCYNSGKYDDQIKEDFNKAVAAGARGTPYSVVLVGNQQGVINGAQPYPAVKQIIDRLLAQIQGGTTTPQGS